MIIDKIENINNMIGVLLIEPKYRDNRKYISMWETIIEGNRIFLPMNVVKNYIHKVESYLWKKDFKLKLKSDIPGWEQLDKDLYITEGHIGVMMRRNNEIGISLPDFFVEKIVISILSNIGEGIKQRYIGTNFNVLVFNSIYENFYC